MPAKTTGVGELKTINGLIAPRGSLNPVIFCSKLVSRRATPLYEASSLFYCSGMGPAARRAHTIKSYGDDT
jgi:hypothetical protein